MDKISALFTSRRFWVAVSGVVTVFFTDTLGMTPEQAAVIVGMLSAWIIGDSLSKTL